MSQAPVFLGVVGGLALISIAALLLSWWLWQRPRRRLLLLRQQGLAGERQAVALLERAGYHVLRRQSSGSFAVLVDGEQQRFTLRADLLVRRRSDGRLLVAEVKTGSVAPRLDHGPTRRQLLEYALAYREQVAGVLLVAPAQGAVTCVSFPALRDLRRGHLGRSPWPALLCGLLIGATLACGLLRLIVPMQRAAGDQGYPKAASKG